MDIDQLRQWQECVFHHTDEVHSLMMDRRKIKETMEEHLKQFFDYDEIEFTGDFNKIILKWIDSDPVIRNDKISELHMDWIIHAMGYTEIHVEVYPFGINEEDED